MMRLLHGGVLAIRSGRTRALRMYPDPKPCELCGDPKSERHHDDGNTANNTPENIRFLCRRCHMIEDGRLDTFRDLGLKNLHEAIDAAALARRSRTHCKRGHELTAENTYIQPSGSRTCKTCRALHASAYRQRLREGALA